MPRETLKITDFSGGLVTKRDPTDLENQESSVLVNLSPGISGKLVSIGQDSLADEITSASFSGYLNNGYGIFSFGADFSVNNNLPVNTNLIAIPMEGTISIFDGVGESGVNESEISLVDSPDIDDIINIKHSYYNVSTNNTGGLRISDGNFDNSNYYTKVYQYMKKVWFYGISNFSNAEGIPIPYTYNINDNTSTGDWIYTSSYLYPPSVAALGDELISQENNREFTTSSYVFWVALDPEGGNAVSISIDSGVANKLQVTTTTDNQIEGAQLPIIHVGNGTTPSMIISLGGTSTSAFNISTTETTYTKYIIAANNTGALQISNTSGTALVFTVDNVSVKEVGGGNRHQLHSLPGLNDDHWDADTIAEGCIGVKVAVDENPVDQGDWVQDTALKFGLSFVYDDKVVGAGGGGQESTISNFFHTFAIFYPYYLFLY